MSKTARDVIEDQVHQHHPQWGDTPTETAAEIIKALDAAGFVIAPKEPTSQQINAAYQAMVANSGKHGYDQTDAQKIERTREVYRAMIAAVQS